ncbi:hypothetical protein B0O99DRAFT_589892 [Bisporella sp. PMI_857]|nr:hypothetical protein B0O99DRAFT_589892 [Bisporella sp. PMI_857]
MSNPYSSGSPGVPGSMPAGTSGLMPRRSSYASVVSGAAPANAQHYPPPTRSGAFSYLMNHPDHDSSQHTSGYPSGYHSRYYEADYSMNTSFHGRSGSLGRGGQLPSFSSAFGALASGYGYGSSSGVHAEQFFIPSYLKGSKYIQALEDAHKSRVIAHKDGMSSSASQPGSLSTSASSINLHAKMAPSHRGMTYDLIEKAPPVEETVLAPLPSKWNVNDKNSSLEVLSDGQEVKFVGTKSTTERDHEACAIRSDHPMPSQAGIYYYEVTIISRRREESSIGIGFSGRGVALSRLPGWEPDSWAYHGDDGHSFCCQSSGKHYGPPFTAGDIIGCGVNFNTGYAFFTKNGDFLGTAFREIKGKLFPSIGMKKSGEHIRVNFGQSPFVFDIDGMMAASNSYYHDIITFSTFILSSLPMFLTADDHDSWASDLAARRAIYIPEDQKLGIRHQVGMTSTSQLAPPLNETELIQSLVLQFLTHDGYVETARAFAEEIHSEKAALNLDPNSVINGIDVKEDGDAGHRQRIRAYILNGDIEKAHQYTDQVYPEVLQNNESAYFRLRCRRFIEMIRRGAEMQHPAPANGVKTSNGYNGDFYDDAVNQDMEIDDHHSNGQWDNPDKMDTEESSSLTYSQLLEETINYGKEIQAEFKNDPCQEVQQALSDAFALLAYADPFNEEKVSHLLDPKERVVLAEEINSAILRKSSSAALEKLYQQTSVLLEDLRADGGPGAFVNIDDYMQPTREFSGR